MRMKAALASSLAYRPHADGPGRALHRPRPAGARRPDRRVVESAEDTTVLISSHDFAEIESFASHIGYLDRGRLRFAEEMASFSQRFREIEVTLQEPVTPPVSWPAAWINTERSAAVVRFVDTQYEHDRTLAEVHRIFREPQQVTVTAMPLRSIFVTLAKAGRKAAA